jgi:GR25 family glycosyltransferase involved in LPS biosynthesis
MHLGKTICLNMIVKNESHVIEKTFDNLAKYITFDYWVICDTGSTDGTQDIIKNYFAKKGIPGELVQHEWKDFGHNRTLSLRAGYNKSDYLLIFDADDSMHGNFKLPEKWTHDCYLLKFGNGMTYYRPQLINNRKKWMYVGVLHEYLKAEEPVNGELYVDGDYYVDSGKTGDRSKDPQKYHKDAQILKAAYHKEKQAGNDLANRYAFYCAQSFKDSNQVDDAIEWYSLVADTLPNWAQEKYYSCVMLGQLYDRKGNFEKCIYYFIRSSLFDPERIEGIVFACDRLRRSNMHELVMLLYHKHKKYNPDPKNKLFLFREPYEGSFECNVAMSASHTSERDVGYNCAKNLVLANNKHYENITFDVLRFYIHELNADSDTLDIFYKLTDSIHNTQNQGLVVIWNLLFKKHKAQLIKPSKALKVTSKNIKVFLSFTSCKRFDLFEQTVNSILNHFLDKEKIDYWFCVDDNSSVDDRTKMKKKYPWIVFYDKTLEEKGHRPSMNIIWNKMNELKPKYWLHIEDDFLFHSKKNYITDSIKFLEESGNVRQVLFNRNYSETMDDINLGGHLPLVPGFVVHDHKHGAFNYSNCHYWPHYSFRPGVVDAEVVLKLGNFDSPNTFFEMDYANRWVSAGYKTAFFDGINCRHIGRLTKERNSDTVKNAYDLNNESQFSKSCNIKIINLKRRPDRKEQVTKTFKDAGMNNFQIVEGIDGAELKPTLELKKLFAGNDFGSRVGVIGCALTHYNLWKALLTDNSNHYYTIFEDDITLSPRFKEKFDIMTEKGLFRDISYLFLGYHMYSRNREATKDVYVTDSNKLVIGDMQNNLNVGAGFAYSINKNGAQILVNYIEKNGIRHGIDYVVKICPELRCMEVRPHIVFSEWYETPGQDVDTDIQKNYNKLDFDSIVDYTDKFEFKAGIDQIGYDCYHHSQKSIEEMMAIALADPNCVGFNTLGFFKIKIETLVPSQYFRANDGIFIKKTNKDVTRVKMICDWQSSDLLIKEWSPMSVPSNIELTGSDNADFHVIICQPGNNTFDPSKTIIYQMEPTVFDVNKNWGAKTWPKPDPKTYYRIQSHERYLNAVQWNYPIPKEFPVKKSEIVAILSHKVYDTGQQLRTSFAKEYSVEVYGRQNYHNVPNYRGPVPDDNRFNVYSQYKYALAIENNSEPNYASEKVWEPILCESLPFYWGCPNLEDYIDPRAFVRLPMENPIEAAAIVQQAILEDWWSQRIDVIREEKKKIMKIYGFFPNLQRAITRTKVVIITLKEFDRSDMIKKTLKICQKLSVDVEIFYGVYGKNIVKEGDKLTYDNESYTYDPKERLNGQPMSAGEFGCAWSHLSVYKKLRDDPKYNNYLVLEDDAELCDLYALNDAIINLPNNYDICHIGESVWYPFKTISPVNNTYFNVQKQFFNGAMAYFVSKTGANKLISDSLSLPADDRLSNAFIGDKINVFAPSSKVFQQTRNVESSIKTVSEN